MLLQKLFIGPPAAVALAACVGDGPRSDHVNRYDSLGVEIVWSEEAAWNDGEVWQIEPTSTTSVGGTTGDLPYSFGAVGGAIRVGDLLVVADDQANQLVAFDLEGRLLGRVGGPGDGPTGFGDLNRLQRCNGNRIYAEDRADGTVQVRDSLGGYVKEVRMLGLGDGSGLSTLAHRVTCSPNGEGFLSAPTGDSNQAMEEGFVLRWYGTVRLMREDGSSAVEMGRHPTGEYFVDETARRIAPHPFGRVLSFALGSEWIYLATGDAFEIDVYERSSGRLARRFRGPDEESRTAETALFEYLRADLSGPSEDTRQMLARTGLPMPESLPAVADMRLDHQGYLWVKRFSPPTVTGERWGIFAPDGAFLGHVTIPDDAALTDIGSDWIVAAWWDQAGVPRVGSYRLRRSPSSPL